MPDLTGYVSIRNMCSTAIKDVSVSVAVDGNAQPLIQEPVLSDTLTSMNKKYGFPTGSTTDWHISFILDGTQVTGAANCQLTAADNHQTMKITLSADRFTLSPPVSDGVTDLYDDRGTPKKSKASD